MSLIWTESFASFRKGGVATNADLQAAGYVVSAQDAEWSILDDMIVPNRVVLSLDAFGGGSATLGRTLPTYSAPVIIGFSVYVPLGYDRPGNDSAPLLAFFTHEDMGTTGAEIFRLRRDLRVSYLANNPQNVTVMTPGRVHYLEVRISLGEIRVWLDDVFVLQHTNVDQSPIGWTLRLSEGDFALSNLYVLNEDTVYPNVRLGRSTRVVGERPSKDVSVDFERPVNADSNAEVAGQDFLAEPPAVLQGTHVGDQDLYSAEEGGAALTSTIHAVSVKVRAMNADVKPRAVAPFVKSGDDSDTGVEHVRFHYLEPFTSADILCSTVVPGYGVAVGTSTGQVWFSENGEHFDGVAGLTGVAITDMAAKGTVVIAVTDDGRVLRGDYSVVPAAWSVVSTPVNTALRAVEANDTRMVAVGDAGVVLLSETGESWSKVSVGTSDDFTAVTFTDGYWLIAGSFTDTSLRASLDDGTTWIPTTAPKPNVQGPIKFRTLGGRIVAMGEGVPIASRLGLLGFDSQFFAATKVGNITNPPPCVDATYSAGVYLFALADGTTLVSEDAIVCQRGEALDMEITTIAQLDDERVLVAGREGRMYLRAAMPAVTELPVLGGWVNGFAAIVHDPATRLLWEPQAAADALFGVRISDVPAYGDTGSYLLTEHGLRILTEAKNKILLEDFTP